MRKSLKRSFRPPTIEPVDHRVYDGSTSLQRCDVPHRRQTKFIAQAVCPTALRAVRAGASGRLDTRPKCAAIGWLAAGAYVPSGRNSAPPPRGAFSCDGPLLDTFVILFALTVVAAVLCVAAAILIR